ncbi:ABC transporter ATP-binding protein [Candidatus Saccharibacteria bacterium]|nr:ABC transporter ATP-binding protein [Candidatus Saccharibacteria bacterium]MBR6961876.1 ABC transporter ATP-binding protein [Candidatus Saccharibacteria bacterium]
MKNILEVKNLTKTYGRGDSLVKAVDDVSLTIKEGEFVAIIGASGSGKSTLLHLIGGVDRPDEKKKSEIIIDGTDITKLNDNKLALFRRDHIGIIYQFYNLIPVLTVKENITLPADLAKRDIDENYLKDLIKNLGLTDRENHLPNQLSGGQQQRTAIGRALYGRPDLILADEPTGNLDSKAGQEIVKLLKLANEKYHQTIILVTHDLEIAKQASRIITVADGKIVSDKGTRNARSK